MILIADSGSTKTDWIILDKKKRYRIETRGINPYFNTREMMAEVISSSDLASYFDSIREIHFYGAGLVTEEVKTQMQQLFKEIFSGAQEVHVYDDLLATARALFQNDAGIACILGTGSNSCFYNGQEVGDKVPALGYLLGDEGSGAYMGKTFLNAIFKRSLPPALTKEITQKHGISAAEVLENVYKKPLPNRYLASYTKIINEYIAHPEIEEIVANAFNDFIEKNISRYQDAKKYPIGFTGSVAFHFKEILETQMKKRNLSLHKIIKAPVDQLALFHSYSG